MNADKSVGLLLGEWRGEPTPAAASGVGVWRWTEGPVKVLGVWFGPDLQVERNGEEVEIRVAILIQKWAERKLSLKGRAEVANTYIASVVYYRLTVVPCPKIILTKLERMLFRFLWKGQVPMVRKSICCQLPLRGGLGMPSMLIRRHALRLAHLQSFLRQSGSDDDEDDVESIAWAPFVRHVFPQLVSLKELQSWVKRRPRLGAWHLECCQALTALYKLGHEVDGSSTLAFYRGLVEGMSDDGLGAILGVDANSLSALFRRTFRSGTMDNFQKSLAWQCYRGALPVRDKLYRHGSANNRTCPRCAQGDETVLHALVQCPCIESLWVCVEGLLSRMGQIRLTAGSIIRIEPPTSLGTEGRLVFLCLVAMAKEVVWWSRLKGLRTDTFLSGQTLIDFFRFHLRRKLRVEREVLPSGVFYDRWVRVARLTRLNGPSLSMLFKKKESNNLKGGKEKAGKGHFVFSYPFWSV
ncbi:MAG: zinc-binding domain-containing protein [Herbaspirillum sp.]|nr:zinc-binding domain-containing protein [Herbaspirillum sp.]